jgi:hypothetical protein
MLRLTGLLRDRSPIPAELSGSGGPVPEPGLRECILLLGQ